MNKLIELIEKRKPFFESLETSIFVLFVMDLSLVCQSSFSHLSLSLLPLYKCLGIPLVKDIETFLMTPCAIDGYPSILCWWYYR